MRLIDAHELQSKFARKMEEWYGKDPVPSMESLMWSGALSIVEEEQTIDAIPVEWILDKVGNEEMYTLKFRHAWSTLVGLWQKEQEAI